MELITICYDNGKMTINTKFFPAPKNKLRKLLKVIRMDYKNSDHLLEFLAGHLALELENSEEYLETFYGRNAKKRLEANLEIICEEYRKQL